ncbi:hypothetical protein [Kangiella sp.]|uniref:hypothetical protein n=1 Tax=Kangiella sp. TaxID=1920245 RepID=UPI003A94C865
MEALKAITIGVVIFLGIMLILGALPKILSRISDPPRMKFIEEYFVEHGCTEIEIKPYSAHYGVRYRRNGTKYYSKCLANLKSNELEWVGKPPDWIET